MSKGTVRWFNRTIGAGFIRTDNGENVLFLHSAVKESDPSLIREGARVRIGRPGKSVWASGKQCESHRTSGMTPVTTRIMPSVHAHAHASISGPYHFAGKAE